VTTAAVTSGKQKRKRQELTHPDLVHWGDVSGSASAGFGEHVRDDQTQSIARCRSLNQVGTGNRGVKETRAGQEATFL